MVVQDITWHSMSVPPDCTRSSTMTTWQPAGLPSFSLTILLSPSRTFVHTTWIIDSTLSLTHYQRFKIDKKTSEHTNRGVLIQQLVETLPSSIIRKRNYDLQTKKKGTKIKTFLTFIIYHLQLMKLTFSVSGICWRRFVSKGIPVSNKGRTWSAK